MKKLLLALFIPAASIAQTTAVIMPPDSSECLPSSACLACAGGTWGNEPNTYVLDNQSADVGLNQSGSCFQSACYYSRWLYAHDFGFSIPSNATIDSVLVYVTRKSVAGTIHDSTMQLDLNGTISSADLKSNATWPTNFATASYGQTNPLWGSALTPATMNNPATGVAFKVVNTATQQGFASVDYIEMKVVYTTPNGIFTATSSSREFTWINDGVEMTAKINLENAASCSGIVTDETGQIVASFDYGKLQAGENNLSLNTENFAAGVYCWTITTGEKTSSFKFTKTR